MPNYHKRIDISALKNHEITILEGMIARLGYCSNDYRINHYQTNQEVIITNRQLHKDLKIIRKTGYVK